MHAGARLWKKKKNPENSLNNSYFLALKSALILQKFSDQQEPYIIIQTQDGDSKRSLKVQNYLVKLSVCCIFMEEK